MKMIAENDMADAPNARDLVSAVGLELENTVNVLRRAEEAILTAMADRDRGAFQVADVQLLDLAIQTIDDLAPFVIALSAGLEDTNKVDIDHLIASLRLAGLKTRLASNGPQKSTAEEGSIELF